MRNTIWDKRIPTLLGISIIIIGITITSFLVKSGVIFIGQAQPIEIPQELKITNISDASFTVSYSTQDHVIGSVNFGKDKNLGSAAFDDRDQKVESVIPHKIHSITVKNLAPQTRYFFSITSGQKTFLNNDVPFEVSTAPTLKTSPHPQILSLKGKAILQNGEKVTEAIVYATSQNGQAISTFVNEHGSYELSLGSMRTNDLSSYFTFGENTIINILIENDTLKSNLFVSAYQETIPTATLSYNYDFTIIPEPAASRSGEPIGFPSIPVAEKSVLSASTGVPQIILPKKDQEFSDQQPQFSGTAIPNGTIKIIINSPRPIETQVTADAFGNWKYRPTTALPPGKHTITITTKDAFGLFRSITQSFVVHAQGTQVNQSATPSATPTLALPKIPTRTPTPTPIRTPTPSPTPTPVIIALNLTPTPTPTTTLLTSPTPTPKLGGPISTPTPITSLTITPTPTLCPGCPSPTPTFSIPLSPTTTALTPIPTIAPPGDSSVLTIGILGLTTATIGVLLFLLTRLGA